MCQTLYGYFIGVSLIVGISIDITFYGLIIFYFILLIFIEIEQTRTKTEVRDISLPLFSDY